MDVITSVNTAAHEVASVSEDAFRAFLGHAEVSTRRWYAPMPFATMCALALTCRCAHAHIWACWRIWGYHSWKHRSRILRGIWRWWTCIGMRAYRIPCPHGALVNNANIAMPYMRSRFIDCIIDNGCGRVECPHGSRCRTWTPIEFPPRAATSVMFIIVFTTTAQPIAIDLCQALVSHRFSRTPVAISDGFVATVDLSRFPASASASWCILTNNNAAVTGVHCRVEYTYDNYAINAAARVCGCDRCVADTRITAARVQNIMDRWHTLLQQYACMRVWVNHDEGGECRTRTLLDMRIAMCRWRYEWYKIAHGMVYDTDHDRADVRNRPLVDAMELASVLTRRLADHKLGCILCTPAN